MTERPSQGGNAHASYLRGLGFKFRPGEVTSLIEIFLFYYARDVQFVVAWSVIFAASLVSKWLGVKYMGYLSMKQTFEI
jgi:hypothetical protein